MSDTAYPVLQHYGTNAQRLAFTPAPAAGTQPLYIWYETDTDNYYIYTTAWKGPYSTGGGGTVTTTGSPASGNLTKFSGGTSITNGDLSGDVTTSGTLVATIATNVVSDSKIRQGGATSVIGRSANSTGNVADIAASADGQVLKRASSALVFSNLGVNQLVVAGSDQSVANNTATNDSELLFTVNASEVYAIDMFLLLTNAGSNTPDALLSWSLPSAATLSWGFNAYTAGATTIDNGSRINAQFQAVAQSGLGVLISSTVGVSFVNLRGLLRVGANSGTVNFQFSQATTDGSNPVVRKKDSWLRWVRVS